MEESNRNTRRRRLPEPFGEDLSRQDWFRVLQNVMFYEATLNLYDGDMDRESHILHPGDAQANPYVIIIDDVVPELPESILNRQDPVLVRGVYFAMGLQLRVSFYGYVNKRDNYKDYPALWIEVAPPMRRVSSLYVAVPMGDQSRFLEIPIAGAPPQVRIVTLNSAKIKAFSPEAKSHWPSVQDVGDAKIHMVDLTLPNIRWADEEFDLVEEAGKASAKGPAAFKPTLGFSTAKASGPPAALAVIHDKGTREKIHHVLDSLGFRTRMLTRFSEAKADLLRDRSLLVMDARQDDKHALKFLKTWQDGNLLDSERFVLLGETAEEAREEEWSKYGMGLFVSPSRTEKWLKKTMEDWFSGAQEPAVLLEEEDPYDPDAPKHILVVEDDKDMAELYATVLLERDYEVTNAYDGEEGVRKARKLKPDLIILDIHMPKKNGLEVLQILKAFRSTKNIPIVVATAYHDINIVKELVKRGIKDYMVKPFDPTRLLELIDNALQKAQKV